MKEAIRTKLGVWVDISPDDPILWKKDPSRWEIDAAAFARAEELVKPLRAVVSAISPHVRIVEPVVEYRYQCSHCEGEWLPEFDRKGGPTCCEEARKEKTDDQQRTPNPG